MRDAAAAERVRAAVASDVQIPAGAVVVEVIAPQVLQQAPTLQSVVRPTVGGLRIEYAGAPEGCSLGYNVQRMVDGTADGAAYFITAAHCTSQQFVESGDVFGQPDAGSAVGQEFADPSGFTSDANFDCPVDRTCRYSDAALIRYDYLDVSDVQFAVAGVSGTAPYEVFGSGAVTADAWAAFGQQVSKVGLTTGLTTGPVEDECVSVYPFYQGADTYVTVLCQSQATYDSGPGDSGAPVYTEGPNGEITAVGIHSSSNGTLASFSRIDYIRQEIEGWAGGTLKLTAGPF